ncbi:hypothetical protein HU200_049210 [Digitaria exilis]|uniref:Uncharacterized protein n=1 Tax=Digitaria exilis TaxID=1010633 RepID=A0A835AZK1_9POAL|nr:hypothetical protein HU200_049210 [Digitaria exilis]
MKRSDDGGRGHRRYLGEGDGASSYSISSCSTGTASTAYTSTNRSHMSSLVAANHMVHLSWSWELNGGSKTEEEQTKRIKSLVQEFFGAPSANCSSSGGDMSVLERWLTELGVGWVVLLPGLSDAATAGGNLSDKHTASDDARRWIQAFFEILETIRLTKSLFPDRGSMPIIIEQQGQSKGQAAVDDAQFLQLRRVTTKLFRRVTNKLIWSSSSDCEDEPDTE